MTTVTDETKALEEVMQLAETEPSSSPASALE